jgi:hypothetical protein
VEGERKKERKRGGTETKNSWPLMRAKVIIRNGHLLGKVTLKGNHTHTPTITRYLSDSIKAALFIPRHPNPWFLDDGSLEVDAIAAHLQGSQATALPSHQAQSFGCGWALRGESISTRARGKLGTIGFVCNHVERVGYDIAFFPCEWNLV